MGDSITMTGSGEMDNGMTISVSFEIDNDDVGGGNVYDSHSMTLDTNGGGTYVRRSWWKFCNECN